MTTKGEKREKIRRNQRKMVVRGRSIFTILRVMGKKAEEARKYNDQSKPNKRRN